MPDGERFRIVELEQEVTRLRRLLDHRGVPATLRHQVRNALGLMRAILRRSAESKSSVADYAAHLEGRFDALLRVQSLLIAAEDTGAEIHAIIGNELLAHVIKESDSVTIEGPEVQLAPKMAELFGLAIHELATNAVKFGAMTVPNGQIAVTWSVSDGSCAVVWRETGMTGLPPVPSFRGFGIDTLEGMLQYQFDAKGVLDFRPEGLLCTFELPLPARG